MEVLMPPVDHGVVPSRRVVPRSAWKLSQAGIWFVPSKTSCLDDIEMDHNGRLQMPMVQLDNSTAYRFHNMMAFEAMHVGTGNDMTAYVRFTKDLVDSAEDVRLLTRKGILEHDLATDDVVRLFDGLARNTIRPAVGSQLWHVEPCRNRVHVFLYESWAYLRNKYSRSPWTLLALLTATLLVVADVVQAVYAVISYYEPDDGKQG